MYEDDEDDFTNEDMEAMKRGYVRPPRKYRVRDDREHFAADRVFDREQGRDI